MNHGKHKNKKKKMKPGYHTMPDGMMMSDKEMKEYHATRGRNKYGGKLSKLSVALGKN